MLKALEKPRSKAAREYKEWLGYNFDPTEFDLDETRGLLAEIVDLIWIFVITGGRVEILLFPKKLVLCLWIGECNIHRFCSLCVYTMPCIFKKK